MKNNKGKWIGLAAAVVTLGVIGFTNVDARDHHRHGRHHDGGRTAVEIVKAIFAPAVTVAPHRVYVAPPPPPPPKFHHQHHHRPAPPPPPRHHKKGGRW